MTDETLASLGQTAKGPSLHKKESLILKEHKNCKELNSDFNSDHSHTVVPVITSDLSLHANSISDPSIDHHQAVFIPQRISNICLSSEEPLNSSYIVASQPEIIATSASPQNICNSSVFKVTNNSSSEDNTLPSTVLITTSPVPPLESPEHCQVSVVGAEEEEEDDTHMSTEDAGKISTLTLGPRSTLVEEVCLYQPTATTSPNNTSQHSPHVLERVVLMAEPPTNNC